MTNRPFDALAFVDEEPPPDTEIVYEWKVGEYVEGYYCGPDPLFVIGSIITIEGIKHRIVDINQYKPGQFQISMERVKDDTTQGTKP